MNSELSAEIKTVLFETRPGAIDGTFANGWNVAGLELGDEHESLRYGATNGEINGFNVLLLRTLDTGDFIVLSNAGETDLGAMAESIVHLLHGLPGAEAEPRLLDLFVQKLESGATQDAFAVYRARRKSTLDDLMFAPWPLAA